MSVSLPDLIDPRKAVAQSTRFDGELCLANLKRLSPLLFRGEGGDNSVTGSARYRLEFGRDGDGRSVVSGNVVAELPLCCQRCFDRYVLAVDVPVSLALVGGLDEANRLPEQYDPLLMEDRLLRSSNLIEDELILAIPSIPRHPHGSCQPPEPSQAPGASGSSDHLGDETNPFAVLGSLKAGRDDNN